MKTDHEVWPILESAVTYINSGNHSNESIEGCRHLFMASWIQLGEDYSKLLPGPKNPMTHVPTGEKVSVALDETLQDIEKFLSLHSDDDTTKSASS